MRPLERKKVCAKVEVVVQVPPGTSDQKINDMWYESVRSGVFRTKDFSIKNVEERKCQ